MDRIAALGANEVVQVEHIKFKLQFCSLLHGKVFKCLVAEKMFVDCAFNQGVQFYYNTNDKDSGIPAVERFKKIKMFFNFMKKFHPRSIYAGKALATFIDASTRLSQSRGSRGSQ